MALLEGIVAKNKSAERNNVAKLVLYERRQHYRQLVKGIAGNFDAST
jgi:hypothetical protein